MTVTDGLPSNTLILSNPSTTVFCGSVLLPEFAGLTHKPDSCRFYLSDDYGYEFLEDFQPKQKMAELFLDHSSFIL
jgi:hypothetical protein